MNKTVLITGTGRPYALGFNLVRRYLEDGDSVFASVRRPSEALEELKKEYPDKLFILTMDIGSTESVNAAAEKAEKLTSHLDLIINNATTACIFGRSCTVYDCYASFRDENGRQIEFRLLNPKRQLEPGSLIRIKYFSRTQDYAVLTEVIEKGSPMQ